MQHRYRIHHRYAKVKLMLNYRRRQKLKILLNFSFLFVFDVRLFDLYFLFFRLRLKNRFVMANQTDIDDLLQCPICLEIFDQPKVLDCQHTFCSNCLKIHQSSQSESFSIECKRRCIVI